MPAFKKIHPPREDAALNCGKIFFAHAQGFFVRSLVKAMLILRFATSLALAGMLLNAAETTPDFQGSKPIIVRSHLTLSSGNRLHLQLTVENNTDDPIQNVGLCLTIAGNDGCFFEWDTYLLAPHVPSAGKNEDLKKVFGGAARPGEEIPHSIEIRSLTKTPSTASGLTRPGQASCGGFAGPVKFDAEWKKSSVGWAMKTYVEDGATKGKTYFEASSSKPPVAMNPFRSRWTFSVDFAGASENMKPDFRPWNCQSSALIDITALARVLAADGRELPLEWLWVRDDTPEHYAYYKLLGKLPAQERPLRLMTLRGSELRVERILSAQVLNAGWKDFLTQQQVSTLQPGLGGSAIQIPVPTESEQKTAKITAVTYFDGDRTQAKSRVFCFSLVSGSEINLDEKESGEGCLENSREIKFKIALRGTPYMRELQFSTRGPKGLGTELLGPNHLSLKGKNLPDSLLLVNHPEFENGEWALRDNEVTIILKPREHTLAFQFTDESGNLINEPISGRAVVPNEADGFIYPEMPNRTAVRAIFNDPIHITASSQHYGADVTFSYAKGDAPIPIRMTLKSPAVDVSRPVEISIAVRPFYRVRREEQLVDASVKVSYASAGGKKEEVVLARGPASYIGKILKPPGSALTASIEPFPSLARFLATHPSYPISALPGAANPIELDFSKPTLTVMINPSARLRLRAKSPDWLEQIKVQSWRVFKDLNEPGWDKEWGYRYFSSLNNEAQEMDILKLVETTALDTASETRESVLRKFGFSSRDVSPLSAAKSYSHFLNGFSYPPAGQRGTLIYVQLADTAPLESGDASIDDLDAELGRQRIRAVIAQLSLGSGEPRTLTQSKHRNLKLVQFYMETESKTFFTNAFDQIISEVSTLQGRGK